MIFQNNRLVSSICLGIVLLSLTVAYGCKTNPPEIANAPDPREELVRSLKGANVNGYLFAIKEEANQTTTSLTNGTLRDPIKLDGANSFVLGYASVKDKKANTTKTIKAEIIKTGKTLALHVTDIATHEFLVNQIYEPQTCPSGGPIFNNVNECSDDFDCKIRPNLLCEANRDCKMRTFDLSCCVPGGLEFHLLIVVRPTKLRCLGVFPFDIDTLTVSR